MAWDGVVTKGWLNHTLEMGYTIPAEAVVVGSLSVPLSDQKQWVSGLEICTNICEYVIVEESLHLNFELKCAPLSLFSISSQCDRAEITSEGS